MRRRNEAAAFAVAFAVGLLASRVASAATVRTDHPRLLFGNGSGFGTTPAQFIARCTGADPVYAHRCQYMGGGASNPSFMATSLTQTAGMAAASILYGEPQRCANAASYILANVPANGPTDGSDPHAFIVPHGHDVIYMAIVRDWCEPSLSAGDKTSIETRIAAHGDWFVAHYGTTGAGTEPADVFHDDYANIENAIAWAGLALAGTSQDAKAQTFLAYADDKWKNVVIPAMAYSGDWWPEGFTYVQPTLGGLAWYAAGWSTATNENIYDYVKASANNLFENYFAFFTYALRPDDNFVYFGDTTHTKQTTSLFIKGLADMLDYGTASPLGQAFSKGVTATTTARNGFCDDVPCEDGWLVALLYDSSKDATATDKTTLPTARWLSKGANDVAIMRSGWGKDDTFVWMSCGDYFGAHQHDEVGGFQIFRHTILTGPTGGYDNFNTPHFDDYYSQHSVHANTLAIQMPNEKFTTSQTITNGSSANVNEGGQRVLRRTDVNGVIGAYAATDLATYMTYKTSGPFDETGDIKTFEHASCHDYVACDMTAAYDSPGFTTSGNAAKVKEVSRQLLFLRPEIVIVFDRVESLDASYEKRFLLHASAAGVTPVVTGNKIVIDNGAGRLIGKSLLPAGSALNVVTGFTVAGTAYPPNWGGGSPEPEQGGNRVEVVAKTPALRDYFLHVLDATDPSKQDVDAQVTETPDKATVTIHDGSSTYVVDFAKTGAMGGHIKVTGAASCDQDLGAMAEPGPDGGVGADGGVGGDGGGVDDGGANGANGGDSGGCGCGAVGASSSWPLAILGAIVAAVAARRRRGKPRSAPGDRALG
jgi:MYXO-CTERM domain-containing protein